ncbi:MAG: class I SAM-dependent methyltransferase [Fluviibacter sp.]
MTRIVACAILLLYCNLSNYPRTMSLPPIIQPASPRGQDPLPQPDTEAQAHSQALCNRILAAIDTAGGWIPFSDYMALALYAPGLGYYSGGAHKFGAAGDFVTGPEMTPLFGRTLANTIAPILAASKPHVTEAGAGTGKLAGDLLQALEAVGQLPERYDILELSAELAERQRQHLQATVPHLMDRIHWLSSLPDSIEGVLVGNEVLDAMPVELVHWKDGHGQRLGVSLETVDDGIRFITTPGHTSPERAEHIRALASQYDWPDDYTTEIPEAGPAWITTLAQRLKQGALLLIDYGFPRHEFYHHERTGGTLMCHYRHRAHPDPFYWPGLQDITAHVDFTAIAEAGFDAGLEVTGYCTQAGWLMDAGLLDLLAAEQPADPTQMTPASVRTQHAVQTLLSPAEMGEFFKVILLTKDLPGSLRIPGFIRSDRSHTL